MQETKLEKIILITIIVVSTIIIALLIVYFATLLSNKNRSSSTPKETGAVSSTISNSERESYDELYNLMDQGEIKTENFSIYPVYQDRLVQIVLEKPFAENKIEAEIWLEENSYSKIPNGKIIYLEASDQR